MPSNDGGFRGVGFTDRESFYIASAYALLITAIFGSLWQFATYFALVFYPTEDGRTMSQVLSRNKGPIIAKKNKDFDDYYHTNSAAEEKRDSSVLGQDHGIEDIKAELLNVRRRKANRYIALVAIWNSSDPYTAMVLLIKHATVVFKFDRRAGLFDVAMIVVAFSLVFGGIFAGVVVPANLELGNVAPANPQSVFFAIPDLNNTEQQSVAERVRAPSAQRAVGVVEYAKNQLRERVTFYISEDKVASYQFNVTGVDFGLQLKDARNFMLKTEGGCSFDYEVYKGLDTDYYFDLYNIYGSNYSLNVLSDANVGGKMIMPRLAVESDMAEIYNNPNGAKLKYYILPDTVGRYSHTASSDPWYFTEPSPQIDVEYGFPPFTISTGRPPLSCWQQDTWSYKGKEVNLLDLDQLGLDVPKIITDELFRHRFIRPMIFDIGSSLGSSILVMSASSSYGLLDAKAGSYAADLERLVLTSYIATQDVLRDTVMTQFSPDIGIFNSAHDPTTGKPKEGVDKFVVVSTKVKALSLRVLISVPVIYVSLYILLLVTRCTRFTNSNSGKISRFTLRATGLQAMQLYRMLDEEKCGDRDDWYGRLDHMPYILDAKVVQGKPEKPAARARHSGISMSQDEKDSEIFEVGWGGKTGTVVPESRHPYLFIAPKVIQTGTGESRRNHLSFVGPVKYQLKTDEREFSYSGTGNKAIASGPAEKSDDGPAEVSSDSKQATVETKETSPNLN
ncbi:uncharacterized protein H6S33_010189 [Morchella sextelata]|uniref:uncharacterized protein n=1 Tax=Morchella sextelata TaxID=1174677 RepID=UPI001D04C085|nr:uncharacterized protein H6S33_010189 [Morchella sextelata]KAH0612137.1 hypothetical protein H6S33_010189 [Morchella sextelata]